VTVSGSGVGTGVGLTGSSPQPLAASSDVATAQMPTARKEVERPKIWYRLTIAGRSMKGQ